MIRSLAKKWRKNGEKMAKSIALWRNGIALWRNGIALWRRNGEENGEVIALWRNGIALWRRNGEKLAKKWRKIAEEMAKNMANSIALYWGFKGDTPLLNRFLLGF